MESFKLSHLHTIPAQSHIQTMESYAYAKITVRKKIKQNHEDIFRSSLSLALLFCIRQFPPIKGGFIVFVTQHLWEYKNVSLKGRFPLCPGSVQDNFHCILIQMQFAFFLVRLGDPDVDGRIILSWIFRKWEGVVWTGCSGLRLGRGGGYL